MKKYKPLVIDDVTVTVKDLPDATEEEIRRYIAVVVRRTGHKPVTLTLTGEDDGENVKIVYAYDAVKFERIRRITGYLVGTIDRWNNGKKAEESDRVKHA